MARQVTVIVAKPWVSLLSTFSWLEVAPVEALPQEAASLGAIVLSTERQLLGRGNGGLQLYAPRCHVVPPERREAYPLTAFSTCHSAGNA